MSFDILVKNNPFRNFTAFDALLLAKESVSG